MLVQQTRENLHTSISVLLHKVPAFHNLMVILTFIFLVFVQLKGFLFQVGIIDVFDWSLLQWLFAQSLEVSGFLCTDHEKYLPRVLSGLVTLQVSFKERKQVSVSLWAPH